MQAIDEKPLISDEDKKSMSVVKKTQCNMCAVSCGLEMVVENNKVVSVRPDPDSAKSDNYCCRKGRAARAYLHHPDRLTQPLKRVGDKFEPISWEQANREIGEKARAILDKHGPKSLGMLGGTLAATQTPLLAYFGFHLATGAQYFFNPVGIEFMGSWWSNGRIYGDQIRFMEPDDHNTQNMVLWGANSYLTHQIASGRKVLRSISKDPNKRLIVVDPALTESARMADLHISLRLGTDSLFLRALIAIILEKGWQDQAFINKWCKDFDKTLHWYRDIDIHEALEVCRVPYETAVEFAEIVSKESWGTHQDLGVFCGRHNTLTSYLIVTLAAITGSLLRPGHNIVNDVFIGLFPSDERKKKTWRTKDGYFPVASTYPAGSFAGQVLNDDDDRIRMAFSSMSNSARSFPDTEQMTAALKKLELFVCDDITMTETARLAHYILPSKSAWEGWDFNTIQQAYPNVLGHIRRPVVEAPGDCKEPFEIWVDIADSMGLIPKLPDSLYKKAEKAVAEKNRVPFMLALAKHFVLHPTHAKAAMFIIAKTLGKAMESVSQGALFTAYMITDLAIKGKVERAGIKPHKRHYILNRIPFLKHLPLMDAAFQKTIDTPEGVHIARDNIEDPDAYTREAIKHKDKKFHLYCDEINQYIKEVTPQQERVLLDAFPFVLSSGQHTDFGVNGVMRNPESYRYREGKNFVAKISPFDANKMGIKDGDMIKVTTATGEATLPAEINYRYTAGYVLVPHHYGFNFNGQEIGQGTNKLIGKKEMDKLTGNPLIRHVPCKIEKLG